MVKEDVCCKGVFYVKFINFDIGKGLIMVFIGNSIIEFMKFWDILRIDSGWKCLILYWVKEYLWNYNI